MKLIESYDEIEIFTLDKETGKRYSEKIAELLNQIPLTHHTAAGVMAEEKEGRIYYGKWEHSLIAFLDGNPVGVLLGYERAEEDNELYPENSFYLNEIAVSKAAKGKSLGKHLIELFIERAEKFLYLEGDVVIRIQTADLEENRKVIELYEKIGFKKTGIKSYPLKNDLVMKLEK